MKLLKTHHIIATHSATLKSIRFTYVAYLTLSFD